MIGSLIGAGLKVAGSVAGAIASSRAAKKANQMIENQKAKNQAWYDRNYNQPGTQRADAIDVMNKTREFIDTRNQRASMANTVMGGTDEALAMQKAGSNEALSDTAAQINLQAEQRKDQIEQAYLNRDADLSQQQIEVQQQKGQNIAQAAGGASQGAAGIVGSIFGK